MYKKIFSSLCILLLCRSWGFGADESAIGVSTALQTIVQTLSWLRLPVAIVAGKLMASWFATGEVLGIDEYLRKFWNIMLILWYIWIAIYALSVVYTWLMENKLIEKLKWAASTIIIWSIAMPLSRRAVMTLIDMSSIVTAWVWNILNQYVQDSKWSSTDTEESLQALSKNIKTLWRYEAWSDGAQSMKRDWNAQAITTNTTLQKEITITDKQKEDFIKNIFIQWNSMSWPLIFLWLAVYKTSDFANITANQSFQQISIVFIIQLFILVMMTIPIYLLLIINFLRVLYIRLWLAFWPIIVLNRMFSSIKWNALWEAISSSDYGKAFDLWHIIALIFQPVISIMWLWAVIIFVSALQISLSKPDISISTSKTNIENMTLTYSSPNSQWISTLSSEHWSISMDGSITWESMQQMIGWWFWYIIISIFTIFMVRWIVRMTSMFSEITKEAVKDSADNIEKRFGKIQTPRWLDIKSSSQLLNFEKSLNEFRDTGISKWRIEKSNVLDGMSSSRLWQLTWVAKVWRLSWSAEDALIKKAGEGENDKFRISWPNLKSLEVKDRVDVEKLSENDAMKLFDKKRQALYDILVWFKKDAEGKPFKSYTFSKWSSQYNVLEKRYNSGWRQYLGYWFKQPDFYDKDKSNFDKMMKESSAIWPIIDTFEPEKYKNPLTQRKGIKPNDFTPWSSVDIWDNIN